MSLHPLQQSREYAQALRRLGAEVDMGDQICLYRNVPLLGRLAYLPRGRWPEIAPRTATVINAADPNQDLTLLAQGAIPVMSQQWLAVLDLHQGEPALMAAMHGKWRNRLRAAMAGPLTLTSGRFCSRKHAWLLAADSQQQAERGYTALPHAILDSYPADRTLLIEARLGATPVAAMLFLLHAPGATYHLGWTGAQGRKHHAHTLILWHAMQRLRGLGVLDLELGTLDDTNTPGLVRFKLGSGAKPVQLGQTWLYLPRLAPLIRAIRRGGGFLSGLLRKGSIGGPRTSQDTPHGSAQHRHYRPR
jgi:hypothetical protein